MNILGLVLLAVGVAEGANILGLFHTHGRSHNAVGQELLKGLAARGHQVTMLSTQPQNVQMDNFTHIYIDGVNNLFKGTSRLY